MRSWRLDFLQKVRVLVSGVCCSTGKRDTHLVDGEREGRKRLVDVRAQMGVGRREGGQPSLIRDGTVGAARAEARSKEGAETKQEGTSKINTQVSSRAHPPFEALSLEPKE